MTNKDRTLTENGNFSFVEDFYKEYNEYHTGMEARLRSCSATVGSTEHYTYLRSYNTIVAIIDRRSGEAFDILRTEYGYTATSAQHISKFFSDNRYWIYTKFRTDYDRKGLYCKEI